MAKVPLTPNQQDARVVFKAMQKALTQLVRMWGLNDRNGAMGHLTKAMDLLCEAYGEEISK